MRKFLGISFKIVLSTIIVLTLITLGVSIYSLTVLRVPFERNSITDNNLSIEVFNSQNLKLNEQNSFNNIKISLESIPEYTKQAFLSIEDKNFYNHNGISAKRIIKAFINNLSAKKIVEGASTISQQLRSKNALISLL